MKREDILKTLAERYGIAELNDIQLRMLKNSNADQDIMLLAPTGSGKTIAFILPVLERLRKPEGVVQCVVIAPSRELVLQIAEVFGCVAKNFKVTRLYGGAKVEDEKNSLSITPDIVVATPGRLLDHIGRGYLEVKSAHVIVLDEFDKMLELGFEDELKKIFIKFRKDRRIILTSATKADILPEYLKLNDPIEINFLEDNKKLRGRLRYHRVETLDKDKLEALLSLLHNINKASHPDKTIIFVNHRESAERVYDFLKTHRVDCVLYHGALEQRDRETALTLFNNGTRPILVATDLAARGLDIEDVRNVIHYHQAVNKQTYIHRNGRTARVNNDGDVYILMGPDESLKDFSEVERDYYLDTSIVSDLRSGLACIAINAGKKEKVSKGDIVGFLTKKCGMPSNEIGKISVFDHYSLFVVPADKVEGILIMGATDKIKGAKRKFSEVVR